MSDEEIAEALRMLINQYSEDGWFDPEEEMDFGHASSSENKVVLVFESGRTVVIEVNSL